MLPQHWFDRLERRFGAFCIPDLASFLVGMNAIVWVMSLIRPAFPSLLVLDPQAVLAGQWWRVLTFVLVPPDIGPLWMIFWLILLYTYARALESEWGEFRFNLFYGIGAAATVAAALLSGWPMSNVTLNTSLFLAFAALYPDFEIVLFFVLPVRARWLAALAAAALAFSFLFRGAPARWEIASGLLNYLLFFGADHFESVRRLWRRYGR
jgi:hypothetical protein